MNKETLENSKQGLPQLGTKEFNDLASAYFGGKPKQETLEEAAREYWRRGQFGLEKAADTETAFLKGAQWQQERMYNSKEDLREAYFSAIKSTGEGWNGEFAEGNDPDIREKFSEGFELWFEQFKKK